MKKLIKEYNADTYQQALIGAERYVVLMQIKNLDIEIEEIENKFMVKIYKGEK